MRRAGRADSCDKDILSRDEPGSDEPEILFHAPAQVVARDGAAYLGRHGKTHALIARAKVYKCHQPSGERLPPPIDLAEVFVAAQGIAPSQPVRVRKNTRPAGRDGAFVKVVSDIIHLYAIRR